MPIFGPLASLVLEENEVTNRHTLDIKHSLTDPFASLGMDKLPEKVLKWGGVKASKVSLGWRMIFGPWCSKRCFSMINNNTQDNSFWYRFLSDPLWDLICKNLLIHNHSKRIISFWPPWTRVKFIEAMVFTITFFNPHEYCENF